MSNKRTWIHLGIMTVCLLVLLVAMMLPSGGSHVAAASAETPEFKLLVEGLGPDEGTVPCYQVIAEGRCPDGSPVPMVYYRYILTSMGEKACALDIRVELAPHPGYTPLLCSPTGEFIIRIPVYGVRRLFPAFCGHKCAELELLKP